MVWLPFSISVHDPTQVTKTFCAKRAKVLCECACMHASSHAAIILMGAERDPETRTFHCVNTNDHSRGEKESEEGGLQRTPGVTVQTSEEYTEMHQISSPSSL